MNLGGGIEGGDSHAKAAWCVGKVGRRMAEMPAELNPTRAHPSDLDPYRDSSSEESTT